MIDFFLSRYEAAPVERDPYDYLYLEGCFPAVYYAEMVASLPAPELTRQIGEVRGKALKKYPERFAFDIQNWAQRAKLPSASADFWRHFVIEMGSAKVAAAIARKFRILRRLRCDMVLVRDTVNYALGPHTDAESKVVSVLFYLPADDTRRHLGTSVYVPKKPGEYGTAHHDHKDFHCVATMPYLPNSLFAFPRTDDSFHGVEPVKDDTDRWMLQYNLYNAV